MKKLPFDIVSQPFIRIANNLIWSTHQTSGSEVAIFKQVQQKVTEAIVEKAVFDYRKPSSNVFEATDTIFNPSVFIPAQWGDFNECVLRSRKRPVFYGMTGYLLPPYFDS